MTASLKDRIVRHIQMSGPLPLAEYMHWCLFDKTNGYYTTKEVLGQRGDFITAPEVSQMFGELIGIWLVQAWTSIGKPKPFNLVEIGPGNGTLMKDIMRACQIDAEFLEAVSIHLIETSEQLIIVQQETLANVTDIHWHKSLDEVPKKPTLLVANEFLDALPFRQYVKTNAGWHERCVILDESGSLAWGIGAGKLEETALPLNHDKEPEGAIFELSTIREAFVERISGHISENGGAALLIDYGHAKSGFGETFQAISSHAYADPLETPGAADLTSHVDFEPLQSIAIKSGCNVMPLMTQGEFLLKAGLLERAGILGSGKSKDEQDRIKRDAERLALPDQMGDLFKVFAISSGPDLWPFEKTA